ncbi:MAG: putative toxin-antitoxin system toxin component, PIN family [Elusimicrobia bacterium]|nr:putative toxin-antitoxin system toxin component, PIN family [Elusimicrobiota bacterium]
MKAVLDCNVIVSGLIRPDRPPAQIVNAFIEGRFEAVLSPAILEEYRRILHARKVRRYIPLSPGGIEALLTGLALAAFWVEDQSLPAPIVVQDPSDDIYLMAAAEGQADYVVSGDRHLLALRKYEGIPIVSPRDFLQALR